MPGRQPAPRRLGAKPGQNLEKAVGPAWLKSCIVDIFSLQRK
jgi:hypothetical protein